MSNRPTSLMTQYAEGCIVSRELHDMLNDEASQARFDRDLADDLDMYVDRYSNRKYREHPARMLPSRRS